MSSGCSRASGKRQPAWHQRTKLKRDGPAANAVRVGVLGRPSPCYVPLLAGHPVVISSFTCRPTRLRTLAFEGSVPFALSLVDERPFRARVLTLRAEGGIVFRGHLFTTGARDGSSCMVFGAGAGAVLRMVGARCVAFEWPLTPDLCAALASDEACRRRWSGGHWHEALQHTRRGDN